MILIEVTGMLTHGQSVEEGDRIAQLIIERIQTPEVCEVTVSFTSIHELGA